MSTISTDEMKFDLYRGMVCGLLEREGFKGNPWDLASSLDMSFEEVKDKPAFMWLNQAESDLEDFRLENPDEFE